MARTCNGSTQWLTRSGAVISAYPLSMFAWFKTSSVTEQTLVSQTVAAGGAYHCLRVASGGGGSVAAECFDGTTNPVATVGTTAVNGAWHAGGAVFLNVSSRTPYFDGTAGTTNTTTLTGAEVTSPNTTSVGVLIRATNVYFLNGTVGVAAIWNAALTAVEMTMLAAGISPRRVRPLNLVAYWPLAGYASPELDLMAHRDLTVTGATAAAHPRIYLPSAPTMVLKPVSAAAPGATGNMFLVW